MAQQTLIVHPEPPTFGSFIMRMNYRYCIDDVDAIVANHIQGQVRDADGVQQSVTPLEAPSGNHESIEHSAPAIKPSRRKR